uniref:CCHC-type domain-containing protein n=1 Tax=Megaselia scalaris TaxID=36166 RepID=T1GVR6_MEGSC
MSDLQPFEKLTLYNYNSWVVIVKGHLMSKELWRYVDGTIEMPIVLPESKDFWSKKALQDAWKIKDNSALEFLLTSVTNGQRQHLKGCSTSAEAWENLRKVHIVSSPAEISTVIKRLRTTNYNKKNGMEAFIQKYYDIQTSLKGFKMPIHETILSIMMLQRLPKSFDAFVTAIEAQDSIPDFSSLKIKLLYEEQKIKSRENADDSKAFSGKGRGKCFNCGQRRNFADDCRNTKADLYK